ELLPDRADEAKRLGPAELKVVCGSADHLDFPAESFDIVLQSVVFTSIQDDELKQKVAAEMLRVVRSSGLILWYDFRVNNPRNADVPDMGRREFVNLSRGAGVDLFSIPRPPPLVRSLAPWSWLSCYLLGKLPWLRTHYLGLIRKRNSSF